jgi:hypothetical protein
MPVMDGWSVKTGCETGRHLYEHGKREEETAMEPQPIGQTYEVKKYQMNRQTRFNGSTQSGRLSKKPSVIIPEELPKTTMCRIFKVSDLSDSDEYKITMGHLRAYQKKAAFQGWDEYRKVIPEDILSTMQEIFIEFRRNGFVNPHVRDDHIVFDQVIAQGSCGDTDPCTMCFRECQKRDDIDTGEIKRQRAANGPGYEEPRLCWQKKGAPMGYSGNRVFRGAELVRVRYKRGLMEDREVLINVDLADELYRKNKIDYVGCEVEIKELEA